MVEAADPPLPTLPGLQNREGEIKRFNSRFIRRSTLREVGPPSPAPRQALLEPCIRVSLCCTSGSSRRCGNVYSSRCDPHAPVRVVLWTGVMAYAGFLLTGQGLRTFNSLSITGRFGHIRPVPGGAFTSRLRGDNYCQRWLRCLRNIRGS